MKYYIKLWMLIIYQCVNGRGTRVFRKICEELIGKK